MRPPEDVLHQAERHVREGEVRVARQKALVARLVARGFDPSVAVAVLDRLSTTLELSRDHVRIERKARGLP